jgi:heme/copper-type cytochrome/quinol oxidase subunit 4
MANKASFIDVIGKMWEKESERIVVFGMLIFLTLIATLLPTYPYAIIVGIILILILVAISVGLIVVYFMFDIGRDLFNKYKETKKELENED